MTTLRETLVRAVALLEKRSSSVPFPFYGEVAQTESVISDLRAQIAALDEAKPAVSAHWECRQCGYEGETKEHKRDNPRWPGTEIDCNGAVWVPNLYTTPQPCPQCAENEVELKFMLGKVVLAERRIAELEAALLASAKTTEDAVQELDKVLTK